MTLQYSQYVESDLERIATFIARHNPTRAGTFVRELTDEMQNIACAPLAFRLRTDIAPTARAAVHGKYLIIFRVMADGCASSA